MKYFFLLFCSISLFLTFGVSSLSATSDPLASIVKLKTYQYDPVSESFVYKSYGSAVAIGPKRIITNAHVILDSDGHLPTGYYEVCVSQKIEEPPRCRDTARLIAYDIVSDLALLELDSYTFPDPILLQIPKKLQLGSEVIIYGYPSIGGDTITRTQGKIAGYTLGMYKIDGTIDHGDSGGGAFDHSGNLIGIPTAVASDNGVIGYMIDQSRIRSFLAKRTPNYTYFDQKRDRRFQKILQSNQIFFTGKKIIPFFYGTIRLPSSQSFRLNSAAVDTERHLIYLSFRDPYDRVGLSFQCTRDGSEILGWVAREQGLQKEGIDYPTWKSYGKYEGKNNEFYMVYDTNYGDSGVRYQDSIYYKNHDACYGQVTYNSKTLDAKIIKKAHEFLKSGIVFHTPYVLENHHLNPYFIAQDISSQIRVIESIGTENKKYMSLTFEVSQGRYITANISNERYATFEEFFLGTLGLDSYEGEYTWENFIANVRNNMEGAAIDILRDHQGKKTIYLEKRDTESKKIKVMFYYPYKLPDGSFAVWYWDSVFPIGDGVNTEILRKFFAGLHLPYIPTFL